jgi:ABC-2 type transport system ATP-binding protein
MSSSHPPVPAIRLEKLAKTYAASKKFPAKTALKGVDLEIPRGMIFGLLGPNGAGKSTLINILAGLVRKSAGQAFIMGHEVDRDTRAAKSSIGIVPQELNLDPFFTPREALELQAGLYGVPKAGRRTDDLLRAVGLLDKADAYARTLSGGMRRRLMVAKAMVHAPDVLVLDEPTAGVDVELRRSLWAYVRELNDQGTTVILTTHYLEEAEEMCERIAIINHGAIVAHDSTAALLGRIDSKALTVTIGQDLAALPAELLPFAPVLTNARQLTFRYRPSEASVGHILAALCAARVEVLDLSTTETDLEDIFLQLTKS